MKKIFGFIFLGVVFLMLPILLACFGEYKFALLCLMANAFSWVAGGLLAWLFYD